MKEIHVSASKEYDVLVGHGLLEQAGALTARIGKPCRAAILSDDTVDALYGDAIATSMERAGFSTVKFVFPHGESSKSLETFGNALNFLAKQHLSRSDLVVALGGGVVGDLAGFVAACYLRGVAFIQIPTTLLADVDSSVGGKTAVDLDCGKNLAGCFYQPSLVLCDLDVLRTLPERTFREGCAEILKYGVLLGGPLFSLLEENRLADHLEEVVCACIACKRDIVGGDEFDRGQRQLLNLGHTVGHAVEALEEYRLFHGECVSVGLAILTRAACRKGLCPEEDGRRILRLLQTYGLPTETALSAGHLYDVCRSDKKVSGATIRLVVPEGIGHCTVQEVPMPELRGWIEAGLAPW